ncbi:MAG: hypothetical protein MAG431_01202 [Chloroflexi bacterium]|nr:hypothetical protein [Chloroflexota bacterium]
MLKKITGKLFRKIAASRGYKLVPGKLLFDWQKELGVHKSPPKIDLPPGAAEALRYQNPTLVEYCQRYAAFDERVTTPLKWTQDLVSDRDLQTFRGHNAYVYQTGSLTRNIVAYTLAAYYIKANDPFGLWDTLQEKGDFGVLAHKVDGKLISRDLLDSILEINFLESLLKLSSWENLSVLDIGAGYGRLAHRMVAAYDNLGQYLCTDAFPVSTFLCDYYLRYKGIGEKAKSIPLDEIEKRLEKTTINLAVNVHSFSECQWSAIDWWMSLLQKNRVKYLMIVPNTGEQLLTFDRKDFLPLVEEKGYRRIALAPKYNDPAVQKYGANPDHYHLFQLAS